MPSFISQASIKTLTSILLVFLFLIPHLRPVLAQTATEENSSNLNKSGTVKVSEPGDSENNESAAEIIKKSRDLKDSIENKIEDKIDPRIGESITDGATKENNPEGTENVSLLAASSNNYSSDREPPSKLPLLETEATTGALLLTFPIIAPPGRNSIQPDLALKYNSQPSNSEAVLGFGWSLNIPTIERINRTGIENLYTNNLFYSSLSGELRSAVLNDSSHGIYGVLDEQGDFLKYEYNPDESWKVTREDGFVFTFGLSSLARIQNPNHPTKVFRWFLEEIRDPNGNFMTYEYVKDREQVYPSRITYSHHGSVKDGIFEIVFNRAARGDVRIMYNAGFRVETAYIIYEIEVKASSQWVRKYRLNYIGGTKIDPALISSVVESGQDESGNIITLPPTTFTYSEPFGSGIGGWLDKSASYYTPIYTEFVNSQWDTGARAADVNGDGYDDLVDGRQGSMQDYSLGIYLNNINGTGWTFTDKIKFYNIFFATNSGGDSNARLIDFDGDRLVDIIIWGSGNPGMVALNQNGQGWSQPTAFGLPFTPSEPRALMYADVNGDGLTDVLYGNDNTVPDSKYNGVYINRGSGSIFVKDPTYVLPESFLDAYGNSKGWVALDVNGDGLADLALHAPCSVIDDQGHDLCQDIRLNQGGSWIPTTWDFTTPLSTKGVLWMPEMNSDGLTDMISDNGSASFYNSGMGWGALPYPGIQVTGYTRLVDANGDGFPDVIRESTQTHQVSIATGNPARLLTGLALSQGGSQQITYQASTQYKDGSGQLLNPKLSTVLYTVNAISKNDGLGNIATDTYDYEGGEYYFANSFDKKFAGFHIVKKTNDDGNITKTFHHQGNGANGVNGEINDHRAKIGKPYRIEIYDGAGNLYHKTINIWDAFDLGNSRNFVRLTQTIEFSYDGNASHKDKAESYVYDNTTGNVTKRTAWGEVIGSDNGTFTDVGADQLTTDIIYAASSAGYLIGLPSQETIIDQSGTKIKETRYYYDSLPLGSVIQGNLTREERWKTGNSYVDIEKIYNSFGLVIQEKDPRDQVTIYAYDTNNLYPATVTSPLNHLTQYTYDYSSGKPKQFIDPNGSIFESVYDGLDRLLEQKQPSPGASSLLETRVNFIYADIPGNVNVKKSEYPDATTILETYEYFDGLNRLIQRRKAAENSNFAVTNIHYNGLDQIKQESLPYFSTGSSRTPPSPDNNLYITYSYDPLLRVTAVQNAVGITTNVNSDWKLTVTDPNVNLKHLYKDAFDNLIKVEEVDGANVYTTLYTYDADKNLIKITDLLGNIRNFTYDGLGRRFSAEDLHAPTDTTYGIWTYTYDDSGNLIKTIDPKNQIINYTYDSINRVLSEDFTGQGGIETGYIYDNCPNGKTRLCSVVASDVTTSYEYDAIGRATRALKTINSIGYDTAYTYNRRGDIVALTNPDGSQINYIYNSAGLIEKVQRKENADANFTDVATNFDYSPDEKITYQTFANGAITTNTYDPTKIYRLSSKITTAPGGTKFQDLAYTYDPNGNITKIVDNSQTNTKKIADYVYDKLDRLTSATITNAGNSQNYIQTYAYDAIGNIINKSDVGDYVYAGTGFANPHAATSIGSKTQTYDNNGNLLSDSIQPYGWDYQNQLIKATLGGTETTTITSTSTMTFYAATGDGSIYHNSSSSWDTAHDATAGSSANYTSTTGYVRTGKTLTNRFQIERSFLPFNTGDLPDNASIVSAKLKIYVSSKKNQDNDGDDWVSIVQTSQPSVTTLATADYDLAGSINNPIEGIDASERKDITSVSTSKYLIFNLNPTGRSWVNKTGYTKLGLREGHDVLDRPFVGSLNKYNELQIRTANYSGTASDPVLEVTYTTTTTTTSSAPSITYAYDHTGQRVKTVNGAKTTVYPSRYFNSDGSTSSPSSTKHIFAGDTLIAALIGSNASSTINYIHTDHLSGSNVITSATGTVVELLDYYPYGDIRLDEKTSAFSEQRKFIGQEYDIDTGLSYLNARYYSGKTGKFLSQDPEFLAIGDGGQERLKEILSDPQRLNSYSYSRNNPIRYADPDGESFKDYINAISIKGYVSGFGKTFLPNIGRSIGSLADSTGHPIQTGKALINFFRESADSAKQLSGAQARSEAIIGVKIIISDFWTKSPYEQGFIIGSIFSQIIADMIVGYTDVPFFDLVNLETSHEQYRDYVKKFTEKSSMMKSANGSSDVYFDNSSRNDDSGTLNWGLVPEADPKNFKKEPRK